MSLRAIELFSGLGGWRYALGNRGHVVAAYDISDIANATYDLNHGHHPFAKELASITLDQLASHGADTWFMSPPCQPFCRMGNKQGLDDSRSQAFLHLMELFDAAPPTFLALENVEGFLGSDAHALLLDRLRSHGFHALEYQLCPTRFGIPNRRPRVFIIASRHTLTSLEAPEITACPVSTFLDLEEDPSLYLDDTILAKHGAGLDVVVSKSTSSACFIGGYGQRYVGSGSFLKTAKGIRRFSPSEIARLMGLPNSFRFPEHVPLEKRYKLLGNGLNITVAGWVLQQLAV